MYKIEHVLYLRVENITLEVFTKIFPKSSKNLINKEESFSHFLIMLDIVFLIIIFLEFNRSQNIRFLCLYEVNLNALW